MRLAAACSPGVARVAGVFPFEAIEQASDVTITHHKLTVYLSCLTVQVALWLSCKITQCHRAPEPGCKY